MVRVIDLRPAFHQRPLQCVQGQRAAQGPAQFPTAQTAGKDVQDDGQVDELPLQPNVGELSMNKTQQRRFGIIRLIAVSVSIALAVVVFLLLRQAGFTTTQAVARVGVVLSLCGILIAMAEPLSKLLRRIRKKQT